MIKDLVEKALKYVLKDGDHFSIDDVSFSSNKETTCIVSYSRYCSGGSYCLVMDVRLDGGKVKMGKGNHRAQTIEVELSNPDSFRRIGEILAEEASTMQTDRDKDFYGVRPGEIYRRN